MSPADRRIQELIEKWRGSVDLHLQYVELSDAAYARAQPWPKHDRPTRWVLEVAQQKLAELQRHCSTRQAMGDSQFAEALELMVFLANLVGIQHIQRFIPLAELSRQTSGTTDTAAPAPTPSPASASASAPTSTPTSPPTSAPDPVPAPTGSTSITRTLEAPTLVRAVRARSGDDTTREMPRLRVTAANPPPNTAPVLTAAATKPATVKEEAMRVAAQPRASSTQRSAASPKSDARSPTKPAARPGNAEPAPKAAAVESKGVTPDQKNKIISDAVRLLKWGKPWHELAELIGRMADRPSVSDIRKLLRTHKADIETRAKTKTK